MSNKQKKNRPERRDYLTADSQNENLTDARDDGENGQSDGVASMKCFWIAVGCCAVGAVLLGLTFTVLGVYALLASLICELAAVSFLNGQKKHGYFTLCKVVRVVSYAIMIAGVVIMVWIIGMKAAV